MIRTLLIWVIVGSLNLMSITSSLAQENIGFLRTGEGAPWYKGFMGYPLKSGGVDRGCFLGECNEIGIYFPSVDEYNPKTKRCFIYYSRGRTLESLGGLTKPTFYKGKEKVTGNPDYTVFSCVRNRG